MSYLLFNFWNIACLLIALFAAWISLRATNKWIRSIAGMIAGAAAVWSFFLPRYIFH
jgi:hypothetical protein